MTQRPIDTAIADEARDDFIHALHVELRRLRHRAWIAGLLAGASFWIGLVAAFLIGLIFEVPGVCP